MTVGKSITEQARLAVQTVMERDNLRLLKCISKVTLNVWGHFLKSISRGRLNVWDIFVSVVEKDYTQNQFFLKNH